MCGIRHICHKKVNCYRLNEQSSVLCYVQQLDYWLNKLPGTFFGTMTFNTEGAVWIVIGVFAKGSPSKCTGRAQSDSTTISLHW